MELTSTITFFAENRKEEDITGEEKTNLNLEPIGTKRLFVNDVMGSSLVAHWLLVGGDQGSNPGREE